MYEHEKMAVIYEEHAHKRMLALMEESEEMGKTRHCSVMLLALVAVVRCVVMVVCEFI